MTVWSRIAASLVGLPPARTTGVAVERDLAAKMPDGAVLLADRWYPTTDPGRPADRVDPHAVRAAHHPPARTAVRRARLPDGDPELPGDVRLGGGVGSGPQRAGRRPRDARVGGGPAVVRRPSRHVGRELPGHHAVGHCAGRARLRQGARAADHRVEHPRRHRVPGRLLRARDGTDLDLPVGAPGARLAHRRAQPAAGAPKSWRRRPTCCPSGAATWQPSGRPPRPTRTGSSTAPPGTRGGTASTSGSGWSTCRRPAWSAGGTTSSCRPRWPTTRRCARRAGPPA